MALALAVIGAYANVYGNGFLLDDEFLLQKNRFITDWEYFGRIFTSSSTMGAGGQDSFYRPMQTLAYFIVHQIFGLRPWAFHALNVLLHVLNAFLIFKLGTERLKVSAPFIFAATLLWALHPVHTEAVTYLSATADPLHSAFMLLGLLAFPRMWLASLYFIAGLLSKESAIVFPVMCMVMIAIEAEKPLDWRAYLKTWPLWLIAIIYLILRKTVLDFDDTFSFYAEPNIYTESMWFRFLTFLATLPAYLSLLFWPTGLHMERNFPVFTSWLTWPTVLGTIILLLAFWGWFRERKNPIRPYSLMGLWFFAAHIPHTGVLLPVNSLFLEHWLYFPSIGFFLGGARRLSSLKKVPRWSPVLVGVIAANLAVLTFQQNRVWADPITFYEHILSHTRGTQRVHNNLGMAYSDAGQDDKAIEQYLKAIAIRDNVPHAHHNLAELYMKRGEYQTALVHLHRAVEINPRFYYSYRNLAAAYQRLGQHDKAALFYNMYLQYKPD